MTEDKDRTSVGKTVVTMCTKCKMELNHVVIVHNEEGIIDRVKCNTCGSEHKYRRAKKKADSTKAETTKRAPRKKKTDPSEIYGSLDKKYRDKAPVPYSMSGSFNDEDVIAHKVFGKGFVTGLPTSQQIQVTFIDGTRILACNR
jgi:hypothetical protein